MTIFRPKPWVNPFGKMTIFELFTLEYCKRHFLGLNCLKQIVGKMAKFGPKPYVNPFGKMTIFELFKLFLFIA